VLVLAVCWNPLNIEVVAGFGVGNPENICEVAGKGGWNPDSVWEVSDLDGLCPSVNVGKLLDLV